MNLRDRLTRDRRVRGSDRAAAGRRQHGRGLPALHPVHGHPRAGGVVTTAPILLNPVEDLIGPCPSWCELTCQDPADETHTVKTEVAREVCGTDNDGHVVVETWQSAHANGVVLLCGDDFAEFTAAQARKFAAELVAAADRIESSADQGDRR